jgi:hypothetical protein
LRKILSYFTMTFTLLFFIFLILTFLFPEILRAFKLGPVESRTIIMNLISLILVLNFLQPHLNLPWRIFCLISSFIILIESILMLGAWQQLFK